MVVRVHDKRVICSFGHVDPLYLYIYNGLTTCPMDLNIFYVMQFQDGSQHSYEAVRFASVMTSSGSLVGLVVSKSHACYLLEGAG